VPIGVLEWGLVNERYNTIIGTLGGSRTMEDFAATAPLICRAALHNVHGRGIEGTGCNLAKYTCSNFIIRRLPDRVRESIECQKVVESDKRGRTHTHKRAHTPLIEATDRSLGTELKNE